MFVMSLNDNVGNFHHKIKKIGMGGALCKNLQSMFLSVAPGIWSHCMFDLNSPMTFTKHPAGWSGDSHVTGAGSDLRKTMSPVHKREGAHSKKGFFNTR